MFWFEFFIFAPFLHGELARENGLELAQDHDVPVSFCFRVGSDLQYPTCLLQLNMSIGSLFTVIFAYNFSAQTPDLTEQWVSDPCPPMRDVFQVLSVKNNLVDDAPSPP